MKIELLRFFKNQIIIYRALNSSLECLYAPEHLYLPSSFRVYQLYNNMFGAKILQNNLFLQNITILLSRIRLAKTKNKSP